MSMTQSPKPRLRYYLVLLAPCLLLVLLVIVLRMNQPLRFGPLREVIGQSVEGRDITCVSFGEGMGGVLFLASIHGSEGAGTPLLEGLIAHLSERTDLSGPIIVVANANPDGLIRKQRLNTNGVDLNRNFPAANRRNRERFGDEALSEPESRALHALIEARQPLVIVSVHQPIACVDYDGPPAAAALAERMAELCQLPVKKLGSRPGSLGAYFGETLGRPIITLELPTLASHDPGKLWARYGEALLSALEASQIQ